MRKLESLLLGSLWVAAFVLFCGESAKVDEGAHDGMLSLQNVLVANLVLLAVHLIFEGGVWMMVPAYVSSVFVVAAYFINVPYLHVILAVLVAMCSLVGTIFTIVLPVPTLPPLPIHGHPVATISDYWIHTQYAREWGTPKGEKEQLTQQRLFMKLWYPADGNHPSYKKGKKAPYMVIKGDAIYETSKVSEHMGPHPFGQFEFLERFSSVTSSHFVNKTNTNAVYGAKISDAQPKWPVVIYSHGQFAIPEKNTGLIERLVSKGYVVAAYYSDDGSNKWPGPVFRRQHVLRALLQHLVNINTKKELEVGIELSSADKGANKMVKMKGENMFVGKLDLDRGVGLLGHSFGATTTMLMCCRTPQNVFKYHFEKGKKKKLKELGKQRMKEFLERKAKKEREKRGGKEPEKVEQAKQDSTQRNEKEEIQKEEIKNEREKKGKEKENEEETDEEKVRLPKIRCGIAMDTWMHPVWSSSPHQPRRIEKPLLCINSDLWLSDKNGLKQLRDSFEIVKKGVPFYFLTMKGTAHQNFTDYCWLLAAQLPMQMILLPRHWLREQPDSMWHFGPSNPFRVWYNVDNILELFFDKHLNAWPVMVSPHVLRKSGPDDPVAERERRARLLDLPADDSAYTFEVCYQE